MGCEHEFTGACQRQVCSESWHPRIPASGETVPIGHHLKHAINHTDVKVHMPFQAGAKVVDESDGTLGLQIEPCAKALLPNRLSNIRSCH